MANNLDIKDGAGDDQTVKTTDNAGVHTPHHNVDTLPSLPAGTNNIGDVDVLTLPAGTVAGSSSLPAGTNNIGDVDILSIAAGDNNIGNVDVVTLPSLPAGSNAIGKLTANSGVDIGDVDVTSIAAGENHLGEVGGKLATVSGSFTRPADTTAYTAGDVVSNSTSSTTLLSISGCARVNAGSGYIVGARLITDKKSITPRVRVHVYNASNPTVAADNAAMDIRYADVSKRIGFFDLPAMSTGTDSTNSTSSQAQDKTLRFPFVCAASSTTLYFLLEALDAFTPASGEAFTLVVDCDQN